MKRIVSLIAGILVMTALSAEQAEARQAISGHYVQKIINRANAGIAAALQDQSDDAVSFMQWREDALSAMLDLQDTQTLLVAEERNMWTVSPCLHADLLLVSDLIGDIRTEMETALLDHRIFSIPKLRDTAQFVVTSYRHLLAGASDPHYIDEGYYRRYAFDGDTWCGPFGDTANSCLLMSVQACQSVKGSMFGSAEECEQRGFKKVSPAPVQPYMCPFDTRYLHLTQLGGVEYGCRPEILDAAMGSDQEPGIDAETEAIRSAIEERDAFLEQNTQLQNGTSYQPPAYSVRIGCNTEDGLVHQPPTDPTSTVDFPDGAAKRALGSPFTTGIDDIGMMRSYADQHIREGIIRRQATGLLKPTDFPPGSEDRDDATAAEAAMDILDKAWREPVRAFFSLKNLEQAESDLPPRVYAVDAQLLTTEALQDLRAAVTEFMDLSSKKDQGIRSFTTRFSFYLLRSCVFRPCQALLERVLKINLEDSCFPYSDESYLSDPDHGETCRDNAGVSGQL